MNSRFSAAFLSASFSLVLLSACSYLGLGPTEEEASSSSSSESSLLSEEEMVTRNVTYTGLLEEGGITIYQQGTHRLTLSDGKMVLLAPSEGSNISLDLYVGKFVEVKGDVRPTVEAGGTIMEVMKIEWIRREADAEGKEMEVRRMLCGGDAEGACPEGYVCLLEETPGICVQDLSEEEEEEEGDEGIESNESNEGNEGMEESSSASSLPSSAPSSAMSESSSSSSVLGFSSDADVAAMSSEDLAASRWTQQYCSTHIGFCIPVHKNWYFKSFGTIAPSLWHVEIAAKTVENMGDGPLVVMLKTGDVSSMGVTDGAVTEAGGKAVGYRSWSDNRHFEISGDLALKAAVSVITQGLKASQ